MKQKNQIKQKTENSFKQLSTTAMEDIETSVIIHTFDIECVEFFMDEHSVNKKPYMSKPIRISNGRVTLCINANKYYGENYMITSLAEFKYTFQCILNELCIEAYSFRRIDIAIDLNLQYENCYKLNLYTAQLFAAYINAFDTCKNTHNNLKSSIYSYNRDYSFAIYDKDLESKGIAKYPTRFEIRFMRCRVNDTVDKIISKAITILKCLPNYIDAVSDNTSKYLMEQMYIEKDKTYESKILYFTEYVSKWAYDIFNKKILKLLYQVEHRGNIKNWVFGYRRSGRNITLYTKKDVERYVKFLYKALEKYKKVTSNTTISNEGVA